MLQTLCIDNLCSGLQELNLLGCQQLSKLVMKACGTQCLLLEPACQFSADLGMQRNANLNKADMGIIWRAPSESFLHSVCELSLFCQEEYSYDMDLDRKGPLAELPRLAMLKVDWPVEEDEFDGPNRELFVSGAERLLIDYLASDGPPVLSLRVIIITALSMQAPHPGPPAQP